ncbi:MAG: apolipoprotein N-acyltransferase [Nitrospirae bacterium]|nr:apolipoprotein N-acyltransferase [Nitrospirota bacterium]
MNFTNKLKIYSPAFLSGILLVLCYPRIDFYYIAWVALVPFLLSLYNKRPKEAFFIGIFLGLPYFFGTQYWIYHSINHYGGLPFIISIAIVFLLCLYLSLYTGLFASLFALHNRNSNFQNLFFAPFLWIALEFLRSYLFTGFPWSIIGYTQYKFLHIIQISDITGIYGVSFLVVAFNNAITEVIIVRKRLRDMPLLPLSKTIIGLVILFVLIISSLIYGQWRLKEKREGEPIRASIIQGNIEQDKKWEPSYQREVFNTYKNLTLKAFQSSPSIIIWPETSVPFYFGSDKDYTEQLFDFQSQINTPLLFGSILIKAKEKGRFYLSNSALLIDRNGIVSYTYDKIHLVPFGEYIPLRKLLFFIDKLVFGIGDYIQGNQHLKAKINSKEFATLICYEMIFPGLVRKFFIKGGDFMVNITNDAWFGRTSGPYQHFTMSVFRSVENRKPLLRAANTGISGFVDSNGRILSKTGLFEYAVITMDLMTDQKITFYSKYGDIFSYICIVISIIFLADTFGKIRKIY